MARPGQHCPRCNHLEREDDQEREISIAGIALYDADVDYCVARLRRMGATSEQIARTARLLKLAADRLDAIRHAFDLETIARG